MSGGARDRVPGPALDQPTPSRAAPPVPAAEVSGVRSPAGVLALQHAAGNAATVRVLGLQRRARGRMLQRAPVHLVMPLRHNFFFGQNDQHGYTIKPTVNTGIPAGYHVTIYPALSRPQQIAALSGHQLGALPDYQSIEFKRFNVTREDNRRAHYYFDDRGQVVWAQTNTEASLEDAHWEDAVQAALAIYRSLGVDVTAQGLYDQLHGMGRTARVSQADTFGRPKPASQPVATGNALSFIPPQLRRGKPSAAPRPAPQPAPAMATVQPPQQPAFGPPAPAPAQGNPLYQRFVPAGWVPPQQPFAQPAPFVAPPQPFVPPPPAARGPGVQIGFDYSRLPPPPYGGGDPLAFAPVFEHADDMDTTDTVW